MTCLKSIANKYLVLCFLLLACHNTSAWVEQGHRSISRWVYTDLSPSQQAYYLALAKSLSLDTKKESDAQVFSHLSTFADDFRKDKLKKLFKRFSIDLPKELQDIAQKNTSRWHYHNAHVKTDSNASCGFKNKGELLPIMARLDRLLKGPLTPKQEAVLIGFQIHLIQDLHQPLHNFTFIDRECKSDLGGNRTCVRQGIKGCGMSLHLLWDIGFGVFNDELARPGHLARYSFSPIQWSQENMQFYDFVYHWKEQENYLSKARAIIKQQVTFARQRQRHYLIEHYEHKTHGK